MPTTVKLNLSAGSVPTGTRVDLDGLVQLVVSLIDADVEGSFLTGQIGGSEPTQDLGIWVKNGTSLWTWDSGTQKYIQASLPLIQKATTLNVVSDGTEDNATSFATVQAAHDFLLQSQILPGVPVTIAVAAGTYNQETPVRITHPQAGQISIEGADPVVLQINGNTSLSFGVGLPTASFTVSDGSKLSVGQVAFLQGDAFVYLDGAVQIRSVTGNAVVAAFVPGNATQIESATRLDNATLTVFPTVFTTTTASNTGVLLLGNGLRKMANVFIQGPGAGSAGFGVAVGGQGTFTFSRVAVTGWGQGLTTQSAGVTLAMTGANFFCNNVFNGIQVFNGSQLAPFQGNLYGCGNGSFGLYLFNLSTYVATNASALIACRNAGAGVGVGAMSLFSSSVVGGTGCTVYCLHNSRQGMAADSRSSIVMQGAEVHAINNNAAADFLASASSYINVFHAGTVHTSNPANNTGTTDGSFISIGT